MSITLRILLIVVSLMLGFFVLRKIRKAQLDIDDSLHWIVASLFLLLLSIFPQIAVKAAAALGFMSPANFVFLCAIFLVLVRLFIQSVEMSTQKHRLNMLVQKLALLNHEQEQLRKEREAKEAAEAERAKKDAEDASK